MLLSHLWCPNDPTQLWDRLETMLHLRPLHRKLVKKRSHAGINEVMMSPIEFFLPVDTQLSSILSLK